MSDRPAQHSALDARDNLLAIADAWPDLLDRLGREGTNAPDGMPKPVSRTPGLVINEHISEIMREATRFARQLAGALAQAQDWHPTSDNAPALLTDIARNHIGHFTAHHDPNVRALFHKEAHRLRGRVTRAAYPDGYRTLDTRLPCEHHDTTDTGQRTPCAGTYTVRPTPNGSMPNLVCSHDRTHVIAPAEWSRNGWRSRHVTGSIGGAA